MITSVVPLGEYTVTSVAFVHNKNSQEFIIELEQFHEAVSANYLTNIQYLNKYTIISKINVILNMVGVMHYGISQLKI